jgi:hypothetical protein
MKASTSHPGHSTTRREEVLSAIETFQNGLFIVMGLLVLGVILYRVWTGKMPGEK